MTCPPPPAQRNHKGWRSAPDAILPGHRWHPSGSRQGHSRHTGAQTTGRPWVARHQRHKWRSQDAMTHHPSTPKHQSSDKQNRSLNAVDEDKGGISEDVHEHGDGAACMVFAGGERERAMARSHQEIKIEVEETCPRVIAEC